MVLCPVKRKMLVKVKLLYLFVAVITTSLCNRTVKGGVRYCFAILRTSGGEKNIPTQMFLLTTVFHCCSIKEEEKRTKTSKH